MIITLIGMSNVGKSYWSQQLEKKHGFTRYCCDDIIENKLADELIKLGYSGIADVAKWMGYPYDPQYRKTSKKYITMEKRTMREILKDLRMHKHDMEKVVIDTTGSVIYTGDDIMNELRHSSKIIYLETTDEEKQQMFRDFISEPKPIYWGDSFKKENGENEVDALARCYHKLLEYRTERYSKYAHVTIPFSEFRHESFSLNKLLEYAL